jgi:hypothetical protein
MQWSYHSMTASLAVVFVVIVLVATFHGSQTLVKQRVPLADCQQPLVGIAAVLCNNDDVVVT